MDVLSIFIDAGVYLHSEVLKLKAAQCFFFAGRKDNGGKWPWSHWNYLSRAQKEDPGLSQSSAPAYSDR